MGTPDHISIIYKELVVCVCYKCLASFFAKVKERIPITHNAIYMYIYVYMYHVSNPMCPGLQIAELPKSVVYPTTTWL